MAVVCRWPSVDGRSLPRGGIIKSEPDKTLRVAGAVLYGPSIGKQSGTDAMASLRVDSHLIYCRHPVDNVDVDVMLQ